MGTPNPEELEKIKEACDIQIALARSKSEDKSKLVEDLTNQNEEKAIKIFSIEKELQKIYEDNKANKEKVLRFEQEKLKTKTQLDILQEDLEDSRKENKNHEEALNLAKSKIVELSTEIELLKNN